MHGLKCAGAFPGWTRLCDEWLGAVAERSTDDGSTPWERPGVPIRIVGAAVARTRGFATGVVEGPVLPGPEGLLRFEMQGVPYVVAADEWTPDPGEAMVDGARARLETLLERSKNAAAPEEHPVALLVLAPRRAGAREALGREQLEAWVDAFRGADLTHALAYSFPERSRGDEGPAAPAASSADEWPGAFLLARSAIFG